MVHFTLPIFTEHHRLAHWLSLPLLTELVWLNHSLVRSPNCPALSARASENLWQLVSLLSTRTVREPILVVKTEAWHAHAGMQAGARQHHLFNNAAGSSS